MAVYRMTHQQALQLQQYHPFLTVVPFGPLPLYNPPWPAYQEPGPLALRLLQIGGMPRSELCKVPAAEFIQVRNYQAGYLDDYKVWASQQRFGRVEHLNRCAMIKAQLASAFDDWMRLAAMYVNDEGLPRALQAQELASQRFPAIFSWSEEVQRAAADPCGFVEETNEDDADLQAYRSLEKGFGVPAAASKAKKSAKSTKKQHKITKTTTKTTRKTTTDRQKTSTKSKNEASLASLQASLPK